MGREPAAAFVESCPSIAGLPGAHTNDWFFRRSIFTAIPANGRCPEAGLDPSFNQKISNGWNGSGPALRSSLRERPQAV